MSKKTTTRGESSETAPNLDQVRDILFGGQMRTLDRRLAKMDEGVQREHERMRADLNQRFEHLEEWAKQKVEALDEKIKSERTKRTEELKMIRADLKKGLTDLDRSLVQLDEAKSGADSELRDQILALTKTVSANIAALSDQLTGDLARVAAELRFDKTDTASLVELFSDVARRLGESIQAPNEE
jgi:phage host-nuclease inhibitor protein Gam